MSLLLTILLFSAFSCIVLADEPIPKIISQAVGLKGGYQNPRELFSKQMPNFLNF